MNTTGEIQATLKRQLQMVSTSIVFADSSLQDEIKNAYLWATDKYPFPNLEKSSFTEAGGTDEYFDLPSQYKSDSLTSVVIDNLEYKLISFRDFRKFKRENPNSTERYAACYGRQYFVTPKPAVDKVIYLWGIIQPAELAFPDGLTIFSDSEASINEALMLKAKSSLLSSKNKITASNEALKRAKVILGDAWDAIVLRKANFQRKDAPFFDVPNFFPDGNSNVASVGNFTTNRN